MRCPRCSAAIGPEQDWCLECGAPARTRLAPTPNWRVPTMTIAAIVLLAGALLAFAFVKLTGDDNAPAGTTPTAVLETTAPAVVAPPATTTPTVPTTTPTAPATTPTTPATTPVPAPTPTTPGPATTTPPQTTTASQVPVVPVPGQTTTPPP